MNVDGSKKQQLTHFNQPGFPEYEATPVIGVIPVWGGDGAQVLAYDPRGLQPWIVHFYGACGKWGT